MRRARGREGPAEGWTGRVDAGNRGPSVERPDIAVGPGPPDGRTGTGRHAAASPDRTDSALGRREFLALGAGAFVLLGLPRAVRGQRRTLVRRAVPAMGTIAEIAIPARDPAWARAAIDAAIAEIRATEDHLTRFRAGSDVVRANLAPAGDAVRVGPTTAEALRSAIRWAEITDGRFDPCLERAIVLWDVGARTAPPRREAVGRFARRGLYRHLELAAAGEGADVRLHDPDAGIDLGGVGKGIGVDRAVRTLRRLGVTDALVSLGGDLYAMGRSEDGDRWTIGVRSPRAPGRLATTLEASDRAVATSGDYLQYFEHEGRRYHHILDPATGEPRRSRWSSVTITAASCADADAAATAVFGEEPERARRSLARWSADACLVHLA